MPLIFRLRNEKKSLWGRISISLNDVIDISQHSMSNLQHKGNLVSLQVQTAHFGIGANAKQAGKSFRKNIEQNIDRIKNNPLDVIVTLIRIYWEVPTTMINVIPIPLWELFKTPWTETVVAEFNNILFKARVKNFRVHPNIFQQEDLPCRWNLL